MEEVKNTKLIGIGNEGIKKLEEVESNPVSVAKLRRWMRNCMPLMEELMAGDFHPKMKMFSAREVRLIVRYLGEPDGYVFMHEHADVK